jgi:2-isopropylmalate synthase
MCTHLTAATLIVSLHTHNDRGTGVAATELALLAGADRVEGTLFGNGERTGQPRHRHRGAEPLHARHRPGLDFSDINASGTSTSAAPAGGAAAPALRGRARLHRLQRLAPGRDQEVLGRTRSPGQALGRPLHPDRPGRHRPQLQGDHPDQLQSGKGGVAYVLEHEFGFQLPKLMHKEIGRIVNDLADAKGTELTPEEIHDAFQREYLDRGRARRSLEHFKTTERDSTVKCEARITIDGKAHKLTGSGNGPIDAFVRALGRHRGPAEVRRRQLFRALARRGAEAKAVSYIQIKTERGSALFGAGIDTNIELASIKAIVSALNRAIAARRLSRNEVRAREAPADRARRSTPSPSPRGAGRAGVPRGQILDWVYKKRARSGTTR